MPGDCAAELSNLIYMDNAATSFPKPPVVIEAMRHFSECVGANPGRSGHRLSIEAGRVLLEAREEVAALVGAPDPFDVALTKNATEALNIAILGTIRPGDHVVTTSMEHNSVARPLRHLEAHGVALTVVDADSATGAVDAAAVAEAFRDETRAVVMTHASNVTGTIMPVADVGNRCRERDVLFIVDGAQTAGAVPIDVEYMRIDLLALTGHKSLYGPQGTGALYVREGLSPTPLAFGGTGSSSESDVQPDFMPDRLESGTANTIGAAGLGAGAHFVRETGVDEIRAHEIELAGALLEGLGRVEGLHLFGPASADARTLIVSFTVDGMASDRMALALDRDYGILARVGLQCAPWAHRTLGTAPAGTIRLSCGYFTTLSDVARVVTAVTELAADRAAVER